MENFPISELRMPGSFIHALGIIKSAAARVNADLGLLDTGVAEPICVAANEIASDRHDEQFPVDVFQTGSGTSTNMNANEVIAQLASMRSDMAVHPNDHANLGQSSNDVIPAAIHVSSCRALHNDLLPALERLCATLSGRAAGLGEITLPVLQPGSSIMPGKVNPVVPEAVAMVCAQVVGNDTATTVAGQSGNFQLNAMLPLIAHNLLQSIKLLAGAICALDEKVISGFFVNHEQLVRAIKSSPALVTALNPLIGYEQSAAIARRAWTEGRAVLDVAEEMTSISRAELESLLDTASFAHGLFENARR